MTDRAALIDAFLQGTPAKNATRAPLAGDASNRRYERLTQPDGSTLVLMDAPPEKGEDVRPFVHIAEYLSGIGLSAPVILAQDTKHGFLLIEDLGDDLFARVVVDDPAKETTLYSAAVDALIALHQETPPADLTPYDSTVMAEMAGLAWQWYRRGAGLPYEDESQSAQNAFKALFDASVPAPSVLIQRDYHAENLLWLPSRQGAAKVGLLDFQDAMLGHPTYDLVSLLQDARRDVPQDIQAQMIRYYVDQSGADESAFTAAYHVLGAQRNLRIIGVFARLSMHFGKAHYIDFLPRVWGYLMQDLAHPALAPVADLILTDLPAPDAALMQRLKDQCATVPTL